MDTDSINILQVKQRFGIIGNSPALTEAISRAVQVAPIDIVTAPVSLIAMIPLFIVFLRKMTVNPALEL